MERHVKSLFSSGYFVVGRLARVTLRVHWTTPIGFFFLSGFSLNPLVWASLLLVIVVHEVGHAILARRYFLRVVSIDVNGFGGVCRLEGDPTSRQAAVVAWGGVLAQAVLLVAALFLRAVIRVVAANLLDGMFDTLITSNAVLIVLNLLPWKPLDGADAWRLFKG